MLFNVSGGDRYDGLVTVTFKDGKLSDVRANASTDDMEWVTFIRGLVDSMGDLYPDSGTDGLTTLAEQFFLPDARPYFWKALSDVGMADDRMAVQRCRDKDVVVSLVSMLRYLIYIEKG